MKPRILEWLGNIGEQMLRKLSQSFWNELWLAISTAVQNAEVQYHSGSFKREKVIEAALIFITHRVKMNWLQRKLVALFIGFVIDQAIATINENLGKDWITKLNEVKERLEEILPFIE